MGKILNTKDVSEILNISEELVRDMCRKKILPAFKHTGMKKDGTVFESKNWYIDSRDLDKYIESCKKDYIEFGESKWTEIFGRFIKKARKSGEL